MCLTLDREGSPEHPSSPFFVHSGHRGPPHENLCFPLTSLWGRVLPGPFRAPPIPRGYLCSSRDVRVRKARHPRLKNLRQRWPLGANPPPADPKSRRHLHWFGPRRSAGLSQVPALHKDQPLIGLEVRTRRELGGLGGAVGILP